MTKKRDKPTTVEDLSLEAKKLYDNLRQESDRGTALVGAAFLDDALGLMLKRFFVDSSQLADWLLNSETNGPLGSLAIRAKLAYCLGLLGQEMLDDLNTIRGIRNDFAHAYDTLSFKDQSMRDRCHKINAWRKLDLGSDWNPTTRDCFTSSESESQCLNP